MAVSGILNRNRQAPAEDSPAFGGIAERFRRAGDADRAIALCREGLRKFPEQLSARVTLGWALLDKGEYDAARGELEQVLRRAPDNLAAIRGLAELHDRPTEMVDGGAAWQREEAAATAEEPPSPVPAEAPMAWVGQPANVALAAEADATAPATAEAVPVPAVVVEAPKPAVVQVPVPVPVPAVARRVVHAPPQIPLVASAGGGTPTLLLKASDPVKLLMAPETEDWLPAPVPTSDLSHHIDLGGFDHSFGEFEADPNWAGHTAEPTTVVGLEPTATVVLEPSAPSMSVFAAFAPPQPAVVAPVFAAEAPVLLAEEPAPVVEPALPVVEQVATQTVAPLAVEVPAFPAEEPAPIAEERSPMAQESRPVLHAVPEVHEPVPEVHEPVPEVHEPVVEVREPAAEVHEPVADLHEPAAVVHEAVPEVHEPAAEVHEPVVEVREPAAEVYEPAAMSEELVLAAESVFAPEPEAPPVAAFQIAAPRALSIVAGRAVERQRRLDALERMLRKARSRRLQMTQGSVA